MCSKTLLIQSWIVQSVGYLAAQPKGGFCMHYDTDNSLNIQCIDTPYIRICTL